MRRDLLVDDDPSSASVNTPTLDGVMADVPGKAEENVDLIIVGAGISGLAAAWYYRQRFGAQSRVLILDSSRHVGGATKRVEFNVDGHRLITNGGASALTAPRSWNSLIIDRFLADIGVDLARFERDYCDTGLFPSLGLSSATFFNREDFGVDRLVPGALAVAGTRPAEHQRLTALIEQVPLEPADRAALTALWFDRRVDLSFLPEDERARFLRRISYRDFLVEHWQLSDPIVRLFERKTIGLFGSPAGFIPALDCAQAGLPGFQGIDCAELARHRFLDEPDVYAFPDGLASLVRMILCRLMPELALGATLEDVVTAPLDDARLDSAEAALRIRLRSSVVQLENDADGVRVSYVHDETTRRVDARHCVFASWSATLADLMPELSERQRGALQQVVKPPMCYTKVALRNWRPFVELAMHEVFAPGAFFYKTELDRPVSIGQYRFPRDPAQPIAITMVYRPCPGGDFTDYREEARAAQHQLRETQTATIVEAVHDQLERMLRGSDFEPDRDIEAISINRWPHTYSPTLNTLTDDPAHFEADTRAARARAGNVVVAGVDSHRFGWAQIAIDAAERAVNELPTGNMEMRF